MEDQAVGRPRKPVSNLGVGGVSVQMVWGAALARCRENTRGHPAWGVGCPGARDGELWCEATLRPGRASRGRGSPPLRLFNLGQHTPIRATAPLGHNSLFTAGPPCGARKIR